LGGGFGEEIQEESMRPLALAPARFEEAAQHAVVFQSEKGSKWISPHY